MADPVTRHAARIATLVALPLVAVIALGSVWIFGGFGGGDPPVPPATTSAATSAVTLPAPSLAADVVGVCRDVVSALPGAVGPRQRRPVTGPEQNAAYGDPPVTLACGVPAHPVAPTEDLTQLSGVCWATVTAADRTEWTTVDRRVPVRVTVPGPAAGSAQIVIAFTPAISGHSPVAATVPTGCTG